MINPYIQLIGYWIFYFVIHSLFASLWVKRHFEKYVPSIYPYFRLIYVVFSFLLLLPVLLFGVLIPSDFIYQRSGISMVAGLILGTNGFLLFLSGLKLYDIRLFLGLNYRNKDSAIHPLRTGGLLKYSRHPLYAASILIIAGYFIYNPMYGTLITGIMLILYFIIGIQFEEKKLIKEHGRIYETYKKATPMLFPGIGFLIKRR